MIAWTEAGSLVSADQREQVATTLHLENDGTPEVRRQSEDKSDILVTFIACIILS